MAEDAKGVEAEEEERGLNCTGLAYFFIITVSLCVQNDNCVVMEDNILIADCGNLITVSVLSGLIFTVIVGRLRPLCGAVD